MLSKQFGATTLARPNKMGEPHNEHFRLHGFEVGKSIHP